MAQHCCLDSLELTAGIEAELVAKQLADPLVGGERVRLPAAAVERHHQMTPQPLPERILPHQELELADELVVATAGEIGGDASLDRGEVLLFEAGRLGGESGVRRPRRSAARPSTTPPPQRAVPVAR